MPLEPVSGRVKMPCETREEVQKVFETTCALSPTPSRVAYENATRDLADHYCAIGAVHPEHFAPLREAVCALSDSQLDNFCLTFSTWLPLLRGASDPCVDLLMAGLREQPARQWTTTREEMLAAIGTPSALDALAAFARANGRMPDYANLGFHIPAQAGPAEPRFTHQRQALMRKVVALTDDELAEVEHPIGLPLDMVAEEAAWEHIAWHYCSLDLMPEMGMPSFPHTRLHLVSPPRWCCWTLSGTIAPDGRYRATTLTMEDGAEDVDDEDVDDEDLRADAEERRAWGRGHLILHPFDAELVYCNQHAMSTPDMVGTLGGPPIGLYPNPLCPTCGKLMFHVATLSNDVREFGDAWRSLHICEDCARVASQATSWN